jgi:4-amino-4-deoxy-L-arabinose transferase-like glycosyltransferase
MPSGPWWRDRAFLTLLLVVVLVGAALRFVRLSVLPPGLAFDEAWEGIDGGRILAGARPVFLPANNGREPAFAYSVAFTLGVLGHTPLAIRAAAALWGIATVPAMALLGGVLGGRRLALAAAGLTALSYWPIHLSRVGLRPVALPPLVAAGLALLLIAIGAARGCPEPRPRARWLSAIGAGALTGLSLYTYLPARLVVPIGAFALAAQITAAAGKRRGCWRTTVATAAAAAIVGAAVAAPLGLHFRSHPEDWLGRADQVSVMNAIRTGADPVRLIGGNLRDTLGALAIEGDHQARHNLPGRPIFDPWSAAFFVVGLVAAWRRLGGVAAATLFAWFGAMLVPAVLSDSAPHFLRAVGLLPPLFLFCAVGLVTAVEAAARWLRRPAGWSYRVAAIPLVLTGLLAGRDYFVRFGDPAVSAAPFEADVRAIGQALAAGGGTTDALVGPIEPDHPTLRFMLGDERMPSTFPIQALPMRPAEYYVRSDGDALKRLGAAFPAARVEDDGPFVRIAVPPGAIPAPPAPRLISGADFGPIALLGADATASAGGTELPLVFYWRAKATPTERLTVFVHLVDDERVVWAQEDLEPGAGGYPTTRWRSGELVADERRLPLPPGIPPGDYRLEVGLVRADGSRLPIVGAGRDFASLGPVRVERSAGRLNLYRVGLTAQLDQELRVGASAVDLVGYKREGQAVEAGRSLSVVLAWEWRGPAPGTGVEVGLGPVDAPVARVRAPLGGPWPSDRWTTAEFVQQRLALVVPAAAPAGRADLWLRLLAPDGAASAPVPLGSVEVTSRPREFAAPTPRQPLSARFGDFAEFVGFDAAQDHARPGDPVHVTLYWRAAATPSQDYVVFVHLLDAAEQVRGQIDAPPAGGSAPTRSWLPGEVIRDERTFAVARDAPPGTYRFEVGLYRPDTGQRVPLADGSGDRVLFGSLTVGS